jgi:hypothetical protein
VHSRSTSAYANGLDAALAEILKAEIIERRTLGALKLSSVLQADRFEEDLHIGRVRLGPLPPPATQAEAPVSLNSEAGGIRAAKRETALA